MGHHLFVNEASVLAIKDGDLELVRHFLIQGAMDLGLDEAAVGAGGAEASDDWIRNNLQKLDKPRTK